MNTPTEQRYGQLRTLLSSLVQPTDDWAHGIQDKRISVLTVLMLVLLVLLLIGGALAFSLTDANTPIWVLTLLAVCLVGAVGIVVVLLNQVRNHLIAPMAQLYAWALRMCDGDFEARIPTPQVGRFAKLSFHINRLSEALDRLANEMDDVVWEQTARLQQRNRSIELLYEVAASVNSADTLEAILETSTRRMMEFVNAHTALLYLGTQGGDIELAVRIGGDAGTPDGDVVEHPVTHFALEASQLNRLPTGATLHVPFSHQGKNLGLARLHIGSGELEDGQEALKLLDNVGSHLGTAIAQSRMDEESRHLALMRERGLLAFELHDSLAQTIAALRFQFSDLRHSLNSKDGETLKQIRRVEGVLDSMNTEVRELIANFRAPIGRGGLVASIEDMVDRFKKETRVEIRYQTSAAVPALQPATELHILGVVREALTNIRKHSNAQNARVLLQLEADNQLRLLVEDDGDGYTEPAASDHPGEHIGLSIMRDRAEHLGGTLKVESEPHEGTRVELYFRLPTERASAGA